MLCLSFASLLLTPFLFRIISYEKDDHKLSEIYDLCKTNFFSVLIGLKTTGYLVEGGTRLQIVSLLPYFGYFVNQNVITY